MRDLAIWWFVITTVMALSYGVGVEVGRGRGR